MVIESSCCVDSLANGILFVSLLHPFVYAAEAPESHLAHNQNATAGDADSQLRNPFHVRKSSTHERKLATALQTKDDPLPYDDEAPPLPDKAHPRYDPRQVTAAMRRQLQGLTRRARRSCQGGLDKPFNKTSITRHYVPRPPGTISGPSTSALESARRSLPLKFKRK